jgi:hypothetical protein
MPAWQQVLWLELALLTDPSAVAADLAVLALRPALTPAEAALAMDLLLASSGSGPPG